VKEGGRYVTVGRTNEGGAPLKQEGGQSQCLTRSPISVGTHRGASGNKKRGGKRDLNKKKRGGGEGGTDILLGCCSKGALERKKAGYPIPKGGLPPLGG